MAANGNSDSGSDGLAKYQTNGSVNIPAELYEKLYLTPQTPVKGQLRKTVGNPTPLAIMGFLLASTPLGFILMGWRGAGGAGQAIIGPVYFFGGMLQVIGSVMEWIIGNTFPCIVFGSFGNVAEFTFAGAFWLSLGITMTPKYNAVGFFVENATTNEEVAAGMAEFYASFAFFLCCMGVLVFVYLICALCTNIAFIIVFFFLVLALELLAAAYWKMALGPDELAMAMNLQIAAGACVTVTNASGCYLFIVQMLQSVRFPLDLPVGDLSRFARIEEPTHSHETKMA